MQLLLKKAIVPTLILGWAIYYYNEILGKKASAGYFIKPVFWIMVVLYIVIVLMDLRDVLIIRRCEKADTLAKSDAECAEIAAKKEKSRKDNFRTLICLGSAAAYIFLMPYLGFIIATTLFLFGMFWWLKAPNKLWAFLLAVVVTMGMYALFALGLKVPLYTGFLGF